MVNFYKLHTTMTFYVLILWGFFIYYYNFYTAPGLFSGQNTNITIAVIAGKLFRREW